MSLGSLAPTCLLASLFLMLIIIICLLLYLGTGKKEEKTKTRGAIIVIILSIILITISLFLNEAIYISDNDEDEYLATFVLTVTPNKSVNYSLFIPIPVISASRYTPENEGEPVNFIKDMFSSFTEYNCSITDLNGTYFLKINSNSGIQIDEEKKMKSSISNWFIKLSSETIIVECDDDIILTIEYKVMIENIGERSNGFEFNGQVKNGIQEVVFYLCE
ncbi:MAG: hypothetical protein KAJ51_12845 [Thermoplasmata archaeon]|nr:hypothetical protein [Thermoplasmata archaeon]